MREDDFSKELRRLHDSDRRFSQKDREKLKKNREDRDWGLDKAVKVLRPLK